MKTLTILIGNPRGGESTWKTLYKNVLEVYNSDLALCFGETKDKSYSLYEKAKYIWEIPEYSDWSDYFKYYFNGFWEKSFELGRDCGLAGGIKDNSGSGSIIFALRHFIKNNYSNVLCEYDRVILTRSDHFYACPHPKLSNDSVWVVEGEDYKGITDRHHIFPSKYLNQMLGVVEYMDSEEGFNSIGLLTPPNPESILLSFFNSNNIFDKIKRFPRYQFTVATSSDTTRWTKATIPLPGYEDLYVKYLEEYKRTLFNLSDQSSRGDI